MPPARTTSILRSLRFVRLFWLLSTGGLWLVLSACGQSPMLAFDDAAPEDAAQSKYDAQTANEPDASALLDAGAGQPDAGLSVATCYSCHGDPVSPAPPKALGGESATLVPGVGAHRKHLADSGWYKTVECTDCHLVPSTLNAPGHIDTAQPAELTWSPRARADGVAAEYSGGTCTVYCHGPSLLPGGSNTTPVWTVVNGSQVFCGTCHGLPPSAPHPSATNCESCHKAVIGAGMVFVSPNLHIDGIVQVNSPHPAGWSDPTAHGLSFNDVGADACIGCHGADLSGGVVGVSCQSCHPNWQTNCTFCHGGFDNMTGAPPLSLAGSTQTSLLGVGAHTSHVETTPLHTAWDCSSCHITPTSVLSPGHIDGDGRAEVIFGPLNPNATYNQASGTCSNSYCHGTILTGGAITTPVWNTVDGSQSQCSSCHGAGPPLPHSSKSDCSQCHPTMVNGSNSVIADIARHVDGVLDENAGCFDCHDTALASRRQIVGVGGDFRRTSHHVSGGVTESDCVVCHEMSNHRGGNVRLKNADTGLLVATLTGDPMTSSAEATKLEPFCLSCHDNNAASGQAPFSNGLLPAVVDAAAWNATSHKGGNITCVGDGSGFGCHSNGHGSSKPKLLSGPTSGGPPGDLLRREEGFCYSCHDGSTATTNVQSEFAQASHHTVSALDQTGGSVVECSNCHNPHLAKPTALLIDPDTGAAWESPNYTAFCLRCHDGAPPAGVSFAATSPGTGFDKSAYVGSTHDTKLGVGPQGTGYGCMHCHNQHGTSNVANLKAAYATTDFTTWSTANYALCFGCHDPALTISPKGSATNAFEDLHDLHVRKEKAPCIMCHNTHGAFDPGEPGLINMAKAIGSANYDISYAGGSSTPSDMFFESSPTSRRCALRCHGQKHTPKRYDPTKNGPVDTTNPNNCAACHP